MVVRDTEVWFSRSVRMADVDFDDVDGLLRAVDDRVRGYFLGPIDHMRGMWDDQGLFASVLVCATTIEFLSYLERPNDDKDRIARWLAAYVPAFRQEINNTTLAYYFEQRYRHHIAHKAYVSLGRLAQFDGVVRIDDTVVSVNPFALADEIGRQLEAMVDATRQHQGRRAVFVHAMRQLFGAEVALARRQGGF